MIVFSTVVIHLVKNTLHGICSTVGFTEILLIAIIFVQKERIGVNFQSWSRIFYFFFSVLFQEI